MAREERTRPEDNRPKRVPLHEQKNITTTDYNKPGYVARWVTDNRPGKLASMEAAGWQIVEDPVRVGDLSAKNTNESLGTGARQQVSVDKRTGQPIYAVLMEIKKEYYDEDFLAKQKLEDERMARLDSNLKRKDVGEMSDWK